MRLFTDQENRVYKVFPAPAGRFADPIWPALKPAKIFRLAFRDKGRLIDSPEHPLFQRWAARDQRHLADYEQVVRRLRVCRPSPANVPMSSAWLGTSASSGQTYRLWRDQLGDQPPYRIDDKVLFVCFVGNAELSCHLALGWPLPANVLDLYPEFRCMTNGRAAPDGKSLLGALAYFGLDLSAASARTICGSGSCRAGRSHAAERAEILRYCASDAEAMARLLPKMLPHIELPVALYRGAFVAALARMEHAGVPIDMDIFPQLADKEVWRSVRDAMVPAIDAQYGVYVREQGWRLALQHGTLRSVSGARRNRLADDRNAAS